MMALDFQAVAQVAAGRALNTLLEGLLLTGSSWAVLRCFGGRSSTTRFAVWFSTLLVIAVLPLLMFSGSPAVGPSSQLPELTLSSEWAIRLFATWAVIASVLLARLVVSLAHIYRLRRDCKELATAKYPTLAEINSQFVRRPMKLLVSDDVRIPTALGFFRPAVVIPAWALRELSADELKVIVLHEFAHLLRWDDWTNLAQKVVKALFFFHPAVWWIDSRLALEREIACDDLVLKHTSSARAYAASLVSVAEKVLTEKLRMGRALALAQSALGRVRELSARVGRILDGRPRSNREWRPAVAIIGTLAILAVGAMPYAPELVSFKGKSQPVLSADSSEIGSVPVVPASLRWASAEHATFPNHPLLQRKTGEDTRHPTLTSGKQEALPIPAKANMLRANRKPKLVMANAPQQNRPSATLLLFRSTQLDESGEPVWTLSVWRMTMPNGQTVQEMVVMNSI